MSSKYWFVSALLAFSLSSAWAQSGVSVKSVAKAGILHNQFQGESLERVKVLKLKGVLNKQDIKFINNELRLTDLDLSEATFDSSIAKEGHFPGYLFEKQQGGLQRILLPANIQHLDDNAFTDMFKLEEVGIRSTIYTVGKSAFKGCGRLVIKGTEFKEASLVDDYAFYECKSITSIQLSRTLNKLGLKAFWGCKSLQRVEIDPKNEELLFIPEGAFYNCESLQQVDIPMLVKSIDKSAFVGCRSLSTINMRTIIPPMLADKAFDEYIHPMSVVVSERSYKLYNRSSNWKKFRAFFATDSSRKLYDKSDKEEERIRPTVAQNTTETNEVDSAAVENKPDSTLLIAQNEFSSKGSDKKETVAEPVAQKSQPEQKDTQKGKDKVVTTPPVKEKETPKKVEQPAKKEPAKPAVTTNEGSRTPVVTVPEKKQEETKEEYSEDAFAKLVRENTRVVETKPAKYYDSPIINHAVSSLTLYVKDGMVQIEAPAKIQQLTIIDKTGRTIYANKSSDTLYNTSVDIADIKLLRAVYENGIETKRF